MPVTDGSQPPHDPGHGMPSDDPNAPPPVERPRGTAKVLKLFEMQPLSVPELHQIADSYGLVELGALRKQELIFEILKANARLGGQMFGRGVLESSPTGSASCAPRSTTTCPARRTSTSRPPRSAASPATGDAVEGQSARPRRRNVLRLLQGGPRQRRRTGGLAQQDPFDNLTPLFPDQRIHLETKADEISMRVMDLLTPIGRASAA
jgi:transcription termination factor Rho